MHNAHSVMELSCFNGSKSDNVIWKKAGIDLGKLSHHHHVNLERDKSCGRNTLEKGMEEKKLTSSNKQEDSVRELERCHHSHLFLTLLRHICLDFFYSLV